jgi:hypothetical protein
MSPFIPMAIPIAFIPDISTMGFIPTPPASMAALGPPLAIIAVVQSSHLSDLQGEGK